ncbi:MAG TPA: hypothetical protein VNH19_22265, partial [Candidatus Limnocylindrales bacterium]|nr:hypothetical protein [Candidatus Limnocylindrales bacterium]
APEVGAARRRLAEDDGRSGRNLIGQRQRLRFPSGVCSFYSLPIWGEAWFRNYSNKMKYCHPERIRQGCAKDLNPSLKHQPEGRTPTNEPRA